MSGRASSIGSLWLVALALVPLTLLSPASSATAAETLASVAAAPADAPGINYADDFASRSTTRGSDNRTSTPASRSAIAGLSRAPTRAVAPRVAAEEASGVPRYVYRGGSNSADNLTPRFSDTSGLSTFDNLEAATPPGGKAQVIDTTRFRCLVACPDAPPPGHVSIRPRDLADLQDWMAARGTGRTHPFAQELQDAIVDVVRRPR